jgi:AraC-like DNA-binding protein
VSSPKVCQSTPARSRRPTAAMDVAASLGWSLWHVQTQLQLVGTTPSELIREERLALARLRLQDPCWRNQSVTQISISSGFGDLSTFSRYHRFG